MSSKLRRRLGLLATLGLGAVLVAACGGGGSSSDATTAPAAAPPASITSAAGLDPAYKGKVTVLSFFGVDTYKAIDTYVQQQIQTKYPNVTVEFQYSDPAGITQQIKTGVASGDPADVAAYLPGPSFIELAQAGTLLDLTALMSSDPDLTKIGADWAKRVPPDQYIYDGKTLGIVATLGPMSIWYWKSVFEEAGITTPPTTVDELIAAAKKLRDSGVQPLSMGLETSSLFTADYTFNTLMANFDGGADSKARLADKGKLGYDDPAFAQGLDLFKQLYDGGVFNDSVLADSYDPAAKNLWKDKKVAMFWQSGPWMAHYVDDAAAEDIGVMHFPTVDGSTATATGTDLSMVAFGVTDEQKSPEHAQLVGEVIKAYLSPEAQKMYYDQGIFPADTSVVDGSSTGIWGKVLEQMVTNLDNSDRIVDYATYTPGVYNAETNGIQAMLLGDKSAADVQKDMEAEQQKAYSCAPSCP